MKSFIMTALVLVLACRASAQGNIVPNQTLTYKTVGDAALKLHVFTPPGHAAADRRPAIVFFFGGGWNSGTPGQFYPHCEYLASRGMVAVSAEYRVKSRHGTTPRECVADGKSAIRWMRQHAGELGIDPDRLAAGGGSAGAHVAAAAGTTRAFDEPGEDPGVSSVPDALVLFNPVYDNGPDGYGHDRVRSYWQAISPMHNISTNTPPTVVFLGTNDRLVPVKTAETYKRLMEDHGRRCDLHLYEGQPHGFFNLQNREYYTRTVIEMDRFLASLGYLQGEPTLPSGKDPWEKVELDLGGIDASGLRGPDDGKVAVAYEFCIPDTEACRAKVRAIDRTVQFMPGSRGRIGAGAGQCLCIGSTHQPDYRHVLRALAGCACIERITPCHFE